MSKIIGYGIYEYTTSMYESADTLINIRETEEDANDYVKKMLSPTDQKDVYIEPLEIQDIYLATPPTAHYFNILISFDGSVEKLTEESLLDCVGCVKSCEYEKITIWTPKGYIEGLQVKLYSNSEQEALEIAKKMLLAKRYTRDKGGKWWYE